MLQSSLAATIVSQILVTQSSELSTYRSSNSLGSSPAT
jgi:hypothetical protein